MNLPTRKKLLKQFHRPGISPQGIKILRQSLQVGLKGHTTIEAEKSLKGE